MNVKAIAKAVVAIIGVLVVLANGFADDGSLSTDEIVAAITAAAVAVGVYQVPNKQP